MSYSELHLLNKRATPEEMCLYKHALLLYKIIKFKIPQLDWIDLNFQQTFTSRSETFKFFKTNNYKIGCNNICNRLHIINNKIQYNWVTESFDSFKLKCKGVFL